jgi:hypothetical protein
VLILLGACGIPSAPYLPPVPSSSVQSPIGPETDYFFRVPEIENPEIFEGFEIYYKFFDPQTVTDNLDINGDISLSSPVTLTSLEREGYARLASSTESASALPGYPLIPLDDADKAANTETQIELEFSNIGNDTPRSVYGNIVFRRTLENNAGTRVLKSFASSSFSSDDSDVPPDFDPEESFDIVIALYVLSYGNDYLNLSFNIHSTAVYLGDSLLTLS